MSIKSCCDTANQDEVDSVVDEGDQDRIGLEEAVRRRVHSLRVA
jgi:hypothetical protein